MKVKENECVMGHDTCVICGKHKRGLYYVDELGEEFICPSCLGPMIRSSLAFLNTLFSDSNNEGANKKEVENG